jgi:CheY-like chemotaxis protein
VGGRILIIDDDPVNVKILGDFLSRKGCEVERATDGEEALTQLAHKRPDLVLLDVLLPKINGLDLCRRIKQSQSAPPVFLMSAVYRSPSIQRDAQAEYGADAYFVKPFRIQDLWQHIEDKLGKPPRVVASPLEGDLAKVGFARLLVTLHASEETGVLKIRAGHTEKLIYLERGQPIGVESNLRSEAGQDVRERLLACFMMTAGEFDFVPQARVPDGVARGDISVPELVLEGVRRHVPQVELSREIELVRRRVVHARSDTAATLLGQRLDDDAARVLRAIDGQTTCEDLIARSGVPATTAMQILFAFILLGVAAIEEADPELTGTR